MSASSATLKVSIPSAETRVHSGELSAAEKLLKSRAFTAYGIHVNHDKVVWRRFSEFVDLHARLKASMPADEVKQFPELPQKSWLHANDFAEATIAKRKTMLEAYLKHLVAHGFAVRSVDVVAFLQLDADAPAAAATAFKTTESMSELHGGDESGSAAIDAHEDDEDGAWIASISESISMKAAVASVFIGLDGRRVYTTPNIPLDLFKNAKNATNMPVDERPVVLVDLSRGGLCHQALLLCTRGLYFHYQGLPLDVGSGSFTYPELFRQPLKVDGSDVRIGPTKVVYMKHAGVNADALLELLKNLREYVRMKQLALKINGEEPLRPQSPVVWGGETPTASGTLPSAAVMGQLSPRSSDELNDVQRAVRFLKAKACDAELEPEHAAIEATWASMLQQSFCQFNEANSVYVGTVPGDKLANALKSVNIGNQRPLVFVDNTKHGSGYQATIFTTFGVYTHSDRTDKGSGKLGWEELLSHPMRQLDKHNVAIGGDQLVINLAGAALVPSQLLECLHQLTTALQALGRQLA
jgi:hypothetical protein